MPLCEVPSVRRRLLWELPPTPRDPSEAIRISAQSKGDAEWSSMGVVTLGLDHPESPKNLGSFPALSGEI